MALTTSSPLVSLLGAHGAGLGQGQFLAIPGISDNPGLNSNVSVPSGFDGLCSTRVSADGQVVATMLLRPGLVGLSSLVGVGGARRRGRSPSCHNCRRPSATAHHWCAPV